MIVSNNSRHFVAVGTEKAVSNIERQAGDYHSSPGLRATVQGEVSVRTVKKAYTT